MARQRLTLTTLSKLARRPPRPDNPTTSREQAVRHVEIRRLTVALREATRTPRANRAFNALDAHMWGLVYKWATFSHPNKSTRWVIARYFGRFMHRAGAAVRPATSTTWRILGGKNTAGNPPIDTSVTGAESRSEASPHMLKPRTFLDRSDTP